MIKKIWALIFSPLWQSQVKKGCPPDILLAARYLLIEERLREFKAITRVCVFKFIPIYYAFSFLDYIIAPELFLHFSVLRLVIFPATILAYYCNEKVTTFVGAQLNALFFALVCGLMITVMIFKMGDGGSPYYAGLNLVALCCMFFFPWDPKFVLFPPLVVFFPYYIGILFFRGPDLDSTLIWANSFFILGTIVISLTIRFFNDHLRLDAAIARTKLNTEINLRDEIIVVKTQEAITLNKLSQQFSPQVVSAIREGRIKVESGVHRSELCAIFIDIVDSTKRVAQLNDQYVDKVISMFMEDTNRILLKYDITIDKFLGDGILAFSNDPIPYADYVGRVLRAALEIRDRIGQKQAIYEDLWMSPLQLRMGIAKGSANVGFYGSEQYYHSYTAIGPVINMASRLCSSAAPNQILISKDIVESISPQEFEARDVGLVMLKGFEQKGFNVFELVGSAFSKSLEVGTQECPECKKILYLDTGTDGILVFKCRECGFILGDSPEAAKQAA